MWNEPSPEQLGKIPRLYETEMIPGQDKLIYLHFFMLGSDWYVAEYDGQDIFFGFAVLNNDYQNAEWGYLSFTELREIRVHGVEADCELDWDPRPAREIPQIQKYYQIMKTV